LGGQIFRKPLGGNPRPWGNGPFSAERNPLNRRDPDGRSQRSRLPLAAEDEGAQVDLCSPKRYPGMREMIEPILPQVPVEELAIHVAHSRLSMGDAAEARLTSDGRVGIWARVRKPFLGVPLFRRLAYIGHLGPIPAQILTPALLHDAPLRLRVVMLTPEHLAGAGLPEVHISIWGDPRLLAPFLDVPELFHPPLQADNQPARKGKRLKPA
jgi:hypothetical protein